MDAIETGWMGMKEAPMTGEVIELMTVDGIERGSWDHEESCWRATRIHRGEPAPRELEPSAWREDKGDAVILWASLAFSLIVVLAGIYWMF